VMSAYSCHHNSNHSQFPYICLCVRVHVGVGGGGGLFSAFPLLHLFMPHMLTKDTNMST
jgi:hypothetical protein